MRIQKFLAHSGVASRRKSEELIRLGKIKINGKKAKIGQTIDPLQDKVVMDNKLIKPEKLEYFVLNKPAGYVSTVTDPQRRKTVISLLDSNHARVYPVGRLDLDSEGLMLLTNDGNLAYYLTHPKFQVEKTYQVLVRGNPTQASLTKLAKGVYLGDGKTSPANIVKKDENNDGNNWLTITIHEGKKHQIRRMLEHIGHPVLQLTRTKIGFLKLGNLESGQTRKLTKKEHASIIDINKRIQ